MKLAVLRTNQPGTGLWQVIYRILVQWRVIWIVLLASLFLSGCVNYDVGVQFAGPHRGAIVQHIQLGERLTTFSGSTAQQWLESIEQRARRLQGRTRRVSSQEMLVTIPFSNGAELEQKFNEFFQPTVKKGSKPAANLGPELPEIKSSLKVHQSNLLLLVRSRLSYDLDLRSLSALSADGNRLVNPGSLLDLEFSLKTPWGARSLQAASTLKPQVERRGQQLIWKLQPGQLNHLEVVFWMPSPLGLGAVAIALLVVGGIYLRYQLLPAPKVVETQV